MALKVAKSRVLKGPVEGTQGKDLRETSRSWERFSTHSQEEKKEDLRHIHKEMSSANTQMSLQMASQVEPPDGNTAKQYLTSSRMSLWEELSVVPDTWRLGSNTHELL